MSSKIKVDTIENVAGSGNVSLGSGHNLVVPGNNTTSGNATVGGTLGVTGASTFTGDLQVGGSTPVSSAGIMSVVNAGNSLEWGHGNASGYRSTLGALSGGGQPFIGFSTEHGTNANTFRTRGLKGHAMGTYDNVGGMTFLALQNANADNQTPVTTMKIDNDGRVTKPLQPSWFQYVIGDGTFSSGWKNVPLNPNASTSFPYHIQGGVTTANGNHEVTVPVAGKYQINGAVTLNSASVNTDGTLTISKNNSTMSGGQSSGVYSGALGGTTISMVVTLAANDTVGLDYYFSQSATYRNTAYAGYFSGYLLG